MRSGPRPAPRVNSPSPTLLGSSSRFPSDRYVARSLRSCARRIPPDTTQTPLRASPDDDVDVRGMLTSALLCCSTTLSQEKDDMGARAASVLT